MSDSNIEIRPAVQGDEAGVLELMPQLADFEIPESRDPRNLWEGDAKLVRKFFAGEAPAAHLMVAEREGAIVGLALVTIGGELLSGAPNAHLEALVVGKAARGAGLGRRLMAATEQLARSQGVGSVTLNAFRLNTPARTLYESEGFDGELIRYIKRLED